MGSASSHGGINVPARYSAIIGNSAVQACGENTMIELYQFALSHYCEKARWALDYKGLPYELRNLVPGPHFKVIGKLADNTSVPVLRDGNTVVQGSDRIIDWLDQLSAEKSLTPASSADASMAVEWERSADKNLGVPLRLFFYFHVLPHAALSKQLLTDGASRTDRLVFHLMFPFVRSKMRQGMSINKPNADKAVQTIERFFAGLEERIARHQYLAGPLFSRADLSVSALMQPLWRTDVDFPAGLSDFIERHRQRPACVWARQIYADYRQPR